jgi:hypothetical protein
MMVDGSRPRDEQKYTLHKGPAEERARQTYILIATLARRRVKLSIYLRPLFYYLLTGLARLIIDKLFLDHLCVMAVAFPVKAESKLVPLQEVASPS